MALFCSVKKGKNICKLLIIGTKLRERKGFRARGDCRTRFKHVLNVIRTYGPDHLSSQKLLHPLHFCSARTKTRFFFLLHVASPYKQFQFQRLQLLRIPMRAPRFSIPRCRRDKHFAKTAQHFLSRIRRRLRDDFRRTKRSRGVYS